MVITENGVLDDSESRHPPAAALELLLVTVVPVEKLDLRKLVEKSTR